jgi:hypothetical protein
MLTKWLQYSQNKQRAEAIYGNKRPVQEAAVYKFLLPDTVKYRFQNPANHAVNNECLIESDQFHYREASSNIASLPYNSASFGVM